jgi:hypothetical protein
MQHKKAVQIAEIEGFLTTAVWLKAAKLELRQDAPFVLLSVK